MRCPRALARLRPSAVRMRIRSRATSASPLSTEIIKRPVLVAVSAHGSASDRNRPPLSTICLTMESRAGEAVDPRHRHHSPGASALRSLSNARRSGRAPVAFSR
jgi:hypothetical protein